MKQSDLDFALSRLESIEKTTGQMSDLFRQDKELYIRLALHLIKMTEEIGAEKCAKYNFGPNYPIERFIELKNSAEHIEMDMEQAWGHVIEGAKTPWWEQDKEKHIRERDILGEKLPEIIEFFMPTGDIIMKTRHLVSIAGIRQARMQVALEMYKLDTKYYPRTSGVLVPKYLDRAIIDPFSGNPMRYILNVSHYKIWSIGPDGINNWAKVVYKNEGPDGKGDVICGN